MLYGTSIALSASSYVVLQDKVFLHHINEMKKK
jgi:hypothetical protein